MGFGLGEDTIGKIQSVFSGFDCVETAVLYGSRAMGTFKVGSDIDITLKGQDIGLDMQYRIKEQLDDLCLPYIFDISIFDGIENQDLKDHIHRVGIVLYNKISK